MNPPTYREIIASCFPKTAEEGINGAFPTMTMNDYRKAPGLAPSDIKSASEEIGPRKYKGHLTKVANDRLARWYEDNNQDPPPGMESVFSTDSQTFGSVYHSLLLTPDAFADEFVTLEPSVKEELVTLAKLRKAVKAPKKYTGVLTEAKEFKKEHGRDPDDTEKETILDAAQKRFVADIKFHSRLTEYTEWMADQKKEGKTIVDPAVKHHAERMVDALYSNPENSEIGEYLKTLETGVGRAEVSLFAVAKYQGVEGDKFVQLKGRPDLLPAGDAILDPKTAISVHPDAFAYAVDTYNYDLSMAGYIMLTEMLEGHPSVEGLDFPKKRVGFLAQEKTPPYLARLYWLDEEWIRSMKRKFRREFLSIANIYHSRGWSGDMMKVQIGNLTPSPWKEQEIEIFS